MRIILSPAKTMLEKPCQDPALPRFLDQTESLLSVMRNMMEAELKRIWKCNDALAALNYRRTQEMNLFQNLTPAIHSYDGIAFRHISANTMSKDEVNYLQEHLRIISGFYGLLRPMDGVTPYRLEMGAKLTIDHHRDLYSFWGDRLAKELESETGVILNLASKEYSRAVSDFLCTKVRFITVRFAEHVGGKTIEKGTLCKMARGEMVRWMAQNNIKDEEEITAFDRLGYRYSPYESKRELITFIKQ